MTRSKLIALWYRRFCMEKATPVPSFKTFCLLMEKFEDDYAEAMKYYKKTFRSQ